VDVWRADMRPLRVNLKYDQIAVLPGIAMSSAMPQTVQCTAAKHRRRGLQVIAWHVCSFPCYSRQTLACNGRGMSECPAPTAVAGYAGPLCYDRGLRDSHLRLN
jgi:hypothetical protein